MCSKKQEQVNSLEQSKIKERINEIKKIEVRNVKELGKIFELFKRSGSFDENNMRVFDVWFNPENNEIKLFDLRDVDVYNSFSYKVTLYVEKDPQDTYHYFIHIDELLKEPPVLQWKTEEEAKQQLLNLLVTS